jgi:hypothetical protein
MPVSKNPPVVLMNISGWNRPGKVWNSRIHVSLNATWWQGQMERQGTEEKPVSGRVRRKQGGCDGGVVGLIHLDGLEGA